MNLINLIIISLAKIHISTGLVQNCPVGCSCTSGENTAKCTLKAFESLKHDGGYPRKGEYPGEKLNFHVGCTTFQENFLDLEVLRNFRSESLQVWPCRITALTGLCSGIPLSLNRLDLRYNSLGPNLNCNSFPAMPALKYLSLKSNGVEVISHGVFTRQNFPELETLDLSWNMLGNVGEEFDLPKLKEVYFQHNLIKSFHHQAVVNSPFLTFIDLHSNKLEAFEFNHFVSNVVIDLTENEEVDAGCECRKEENVENVRKSLMAVLLGKSIPSCSNLNGCLWCKTVENKHTHVVLLEPNSLYPLQFQKRGFCPSNRANLHEVTNIIEQAELVKYNSLFSDTLNAHILH